MHDVFRCAGTAEHCLLGHDSLSSTFAEKVEFTLSIEKKHRSDRPVRDRKCQQQDLRMGMRVCARDVSAHGLREACASACLLHVAVSLLLCQVGADVDDEVIK